MYPRNAFFFLVGFSKKLSGRKLDELLASTLVVFPGDVHSATAFPAFSTSMLDYCSIVSLPLGRSISRCAGASNSC